MFGQSLTKHQEKLLELMSDIALNADFKEEELEKVKPVILECMQSAMVLPNNVPVIAEVGDGDNWLEAH